MWCKDQEWGEEKIGIHAQCDTNNYATFVRNENKWGKKSNVKHNEYAKNVCLCL